MAVLFSKPYRVRTALVSVPWFLMDIATYGVGLFTPVILAALHLGAKPRDPVAADFAAAQGSAAIDLFLLIGFLIGIWAVPRFGRLHMQVVGFVGHVARHADPARGGAVRRQREPAYRPRLSRASFCSTSR